MTTLEILLSFATCLIGALLGAIGNKLVNHSYQSGWIWAFYIVGLIGALSIPIHFIISGTPTPEGYYLLAIASIAGLLLIYFAFNHLKSKSVFKISELDPIINQFTQHADHNEICLFGGDLNFMGETPRDVDNNIQYQCLKNKNFRTVSILCEDPNDDEFTKIRYGKLLTDLRGVNLKFYNPDKADLKIRGRLKTLDGVTKVLIYLKHANSGYYEAIETDTANSSGARYNNIWQLVWDLAHPLTPTQKDEYEALYRQSR